MKAVSPKDGKELWQFATSSGIIGGDKDLAKYTAQGGALCRARPVDSNDRRRYISWMSSTFHDLNQIHAATDRC
jgi:hypothetical protein